MVKIQLMKCPFRFWTFSGSALFWLLASYPVTAQTEPIVADTTVNKTVNTIVTPSGKTFDITGGTQSQGNLFHSFQQFSIGADQTAHFKNADNITNIISRVTGGSISNIDGLIRANGKANLFFINPRGIVFGPNARLDIKGSFVASTADSLKFEGGKEFSATNPQAPPLLTISVPLGLQFGSNPGKIVNIQGSQLQVQSGKTLALVGGNVTLEGGNLTGGRIELGSIGTGSVDLSEISQDQGYALGYSDVQNFQDINLSGGTQVNASGEVGGAIQVRGRNINLTGGAAIFSQTLGAGTGGTLRVDAAGSVNLSGGAEIATTSGTGTGGTLTVNAADVNLSGGAQIYSSNSGAGTGGNLTVEAADSVNLSGAAAISSINSGAGTGGNLTVDAADSVNLSGGDTSLVTRTQGTGSAGNLTITTRKLTVKHGAYIETPSNGSGKAGDLLVKATDSVELSGTTPDGQQLSNLSGQVLEGATGNGGNLTVETGRLTIQDGALITASTAGAGRAGDVQVRASDSVELVGAGKTRINGEFPGSAIFSQVLSQATDNAGAGNVTIETQRLTVEGGAKISTATFSRGDAGVLTINAKDSITLRGANEDAKPDPKDTNRSGIFVSAQPGARGNVGNLNIKTGLLTVENGAKISANNLGSGQRETQSAINVRQLVISNGGQITSGSFASGPGGTLTVNADQSIDVIGTGPLGVSTLSAAAQSSGPAGDLNITTPNLNVRDGGEVTVSGTGSASPAGNLIVRANDLRLNRGKITATTNAGDGGNITLRNLNLLLMENQSKISTEAFNNANGGNINIDARNGSVVAVPRQDNDIITRAVRGRGGDITITTSGIFGIEERNATTGNMTNDIDASSQFGLAGTVKINRSDVEPNLTLPELSTLLDDPSRGVDTSCAAFANSQGNSFIITGRGGLPPSPYEPLSPDVVWSDTRLPNITTQRSQITTPPPSDSHVGAIVPATGWVFNGKGQVTLISNASRTPSLASTAAQCPQR